MCCLRVSGFLTEITQQIHSLRASGVISSHFALATGSEMKTFRKSAGKLCTAPGEIAFLVMDFILPCYAISPGSPRMQRAGNSWLVGKLDRFPGRSTLAARSLIRSSLIVLIYFGVSGNSYSFKCFTTSAEISNAVFFAVFSGAFFSMTNFAAAT